MKNLFKKNSVSKENESKVSQEIISENSVSDTDEEELIAVFMAAIAASLNTSEYNLRVKSYRRVNEIVSPWSVANRIENTQNGLI